MIGAIFVPAGLYMAVQEALEATVTADMVSPEVRAVSYRVLGTVNGTASWRFWVCSPNVALQFFAQKYGFVFPIGTLVVNILGCLIIGAFTGITRPDGGLLVHPVIRHAVMIGFLGGFTTFSSFALQTIGLFTDGEPGLRSVEYRTVRRALSGNRLDRSTDRAASRPRMKKAPLLPCQTRNLS
jgi:protein CrcB